MVVDLAKTLFLAWHQYIMPVPWKHVLLRVLPAESRGGERHDIELESDAGPTECWADFWCLRAIENPPLRVQDERGIGSTTPRSIVWWGSKETRVSIEISTRM